MTQAARMPREEGEPATDAILAAAARAGDVQSFEELARRHQDRLLRFLLQRTSCRADAEDALQNALLKAYRYIGQYDARWAFATWLFAIGQRELSTIRRRQRPTMTLAEETAGAAPDGDDRSAEPAIETPGELWALAKQVLTDEQYAALWLSYAEEMDGATVARVLQRSKVWVRVTVFRARGTLRKAMEGQKWQGQEQVGTKQRPADAGGGQ